MENGEVVHLYDSHIQGAESFNAWVSRNVPVTFADLAQAPPLPKVIQEVARLLRPTDWLVAHNARFDLETCLARTGQKEKNYSEDLHFILSLPRFCTMNCSYMRSVSPRRPSLALLCKHFGVDFDEAAAHDATYDSLKLACCGEGLCWMSRIPFGQTSVPSFPALGTLTIQITLPSDSRGKARRSPSCSGGRLANVPASTAL